MPGAAATATVIRGAHDTARCAIRDLSPGGARLVGELPLYEGERIRLRLDLAEVIEVACDVVHVDRQRKVVEVVFCGLAADALAHIEQSISAMLAAVRAESPPTVLIAHPVVAVSSALERDLARIGLAARVVGAIGDALWQLDDRSVRYIGAILSGSFGDELGPVLQQLEQAHPGVRRVLLHGEQIAKIDHPAAGRVDAVLRTPWHFKGLARALDVPGDSVVTTYDQLVALKKPE